MITQSICNTNAGAGLEMKRYESRPVPTFCFRLEGATIAPFQFGSRKQFCEIVFEELAKHALLPTSGRVAVFRGRAPR